MSSMPWIANGLPAATSKASPRFRAKIRASGSTIEALRNRTSGAVPPMTMSA
jgi:hypothetical protein